MYACNKYFVIISLHYVELVEKCLKCHGTCTCTKTIAFVQRNRWKYTCSIQVSLYLWCITYLYAEQLVRENAGYQFRLRRVRNKIPIFLSINHWCLFYFKTYRIKSFSLLFAILLFFLFKFLIVESFSHCTSLLNKSCYSKAMTAILQIFSFLLAIIMSCCRIKKSSSLALPTLITCSNVRDFN